MPRSIYRVLPAVAVLAMLCLPSSATAAGLGNIYGDYTQDGEIDGCDYSASEIKNAIGSAPIDIKQYDPRFIDKLNGALGDDCKKGGGGEEDRDAAAGATARDGSPKPPWLAEQDVEGIPVASASDDSGLPLPLLVLAGLIAAVLLGSAVWAAIRRSGWEPPKSLQGMRRPRLGP